MMMKDQNKRHLEDMPTDDIGIEELEEDATAEEGVDNLQDEPMQDTPDTVDESIRETESDEEDPLVILQTQLETLSAERDEFKDALQRERADFSNFRKRVLREKEDLRRVVVAETVQNILPVFDDFDRAMQNLPADVRESDWFKGFSLIEKKFSDLLASYGIEQLDPLGEPFDHNCHDAISTADSDEYESGTVMDVLQKGYVMDGKCIRPAIVRVAN